MKSDKRWWAYKDTGTWYFIPTITVFTTMASGWKYGIGIDFLCFSFWVYFKKRK